MLEMLNAILKGSQIKVIKIIIISTEFHIKISLLYGSNTGIEDILFLITKLPQKYIEKKNCKPIFFKNIESFDFLSNHPKSLFNKLIILLNSFSQAGSSQN